MMKKLLSSALLSIGLLAGPASWSASPPPDAVWKNVADMAEGDRQLAQTSLTDMFGEDVSLWPEWLEIDGVYIPPGKNRSMLVLRFPMRKDCGAWGYQILSPVTSEGTRTKMGEPFCGNDLTLVNQAFQSLPDIQFDSQGSSDAEGNWSFAAARWRWDGKQWLKYPPK